MSLRTQIAVFSLLLLAGFGRAEEDLSPESKAWNAGLAAYQSGDVTNALTALRPLLTTSSHGVRAAEVVAKLEHDLAHKLGETNMLEHLEAAASAAQQALRAQPNDPRAQANFTRVTEGLAELRESKRVADLLAAAEGKDPAAALKMAVSDVRAVLADLKGLSELPPERRIEKADALEAKAKRLADVWLPLRDGIQRNVTNEEASAQLLGKIDEAQAATLTAAKILGDLSEGAEEHVLTAEDLCTAFYKGAVDAPAALAESLTSQSNAWAGAEAIGARSWQADAVGYTQAFRSRFPAWADRYEKEHQADTNAPPLTAEQRAKIEELAAQLEEEQIACCQAPGNEGQEKAMNTIREISKLLPMPPPQQQNPPPQQNQDQQQKQDQQQQQKQGESRDQQQQQDQQQAPEPQPEKKDEEQKDEQQAAEAKEDEKSDEEKNDEAVLKQLVDRSAEKKEASREKARRGAVGRDW